MARLFFFRWCVYPASVWQGSQEEIGVLQSEPLHTVMPYPSVGDLTEGGTWQAESQAISKEVAWLMMINHRKQSLSTVSVILLSR